MKHCSSIYIQNNICNFRRNNENIQHSKNSKKNDDYNYVTLNFSRSIFKNQLSEFVDFIDSKFVDFIDSKKRIDVRQHINQKQMFDFVEDEKFENFEIEFDLKSHDNIIFDKTKTSQTFQATSFLKRNIRNRNIFDEFFARINDS